MNTQAVAAQGEANQIAGKPKIRILGAEDANFAQLIKDSLSLVEHGEGKEESAPAQQMKPQKPVEKPKEAAAVAIDLTAQSVFTAPPKKDEFINQNGASSLPKPGNDAQEPSQTTKKQEAEAPKKVNEEAKKVDSSQSEADKKSEDFLKKMTEKTGQPSAKEGNLIKTAASENNAKTFSAIASKEFASMRLEQRRVMESLGTIKPADSKGSASTQAFGTVSDVPGKMSSSQAALMTKAPVGSREFKSDLYDALRASVSQRNNSVTMKLSPDNMGEMRVKIDLQGKDVHLTVLAKDHQTAEMIASTISELKQKLQDGGLNIAQVSVGYENTGFDQNSSQSDRQVIYTDERAESAEKHQEDSQEAPSKNDDGIISKA